VTSTARNNASTPHGTTPTPDPTVLTTQQLLRENEWLRELLEQRVEQVEKAVALAHANAARVPTEVDRGIAHLREVFEERFNTVDEKFRGVSTQFDERDTRVKQTAELGDQALKAALQAAKEAGGAQNDSLVASIAKSETATSKQMDQLQQLINTMTSANGAKVDDLKERILRLEGEDRGDKAAATKQVQTTQSSIGVMGLVVFGGIAFLSLVVSLAALYMKGH
jgi:hypothetical protein